MSPDVIVVGAGPAGLAAAVRCAQSGLRVLVLDQRSIRQSAPPESLHPGCERLFDDLGVGKPFRQANFSRYQGIRTSRGQYQLGADEQGPWKGFNVERAQLDNLLATHAADLGVTIRQVTTTQRAIRSGSRVVGVQDKADAIRAQWIVDASGRQHWLARELGLTRVDWSATLTAWSGTATFSAAEGFAEFIPKPAGWLWRSPLTPHKVVWTVLIARRGPLPRMFLSDMTDISVSRGVNVSWRIIRPLAGNGWMMAGEAGAMLDPGTGQGILTALMSGLMAARVLVVCQNNPASAHLHLANYDDWFFCAMRARANRLAELYGEMGLTDQFGIKLDRLFMISGQSEPNCWPSHPKPQSCKIAT